MKVTIAKPALPKKGAYVVLVGAKGELGPSAAAADKVTGGNVKRAIGSSSFKGDKGQLLEMVAPQGLEASRLVLLGIGQAKRLGPVELEALGGQLYASLMNSGEKTVSVAFEAFDGLDIDRAAAAAHFAAGAKLRSYRFDKYRTKEPKSKKPTVTRFAVMTQGAANARKRFAELEAVISGVFLTRDLVSEPANVLHPKSFAREIEKLAESGLDVEVLGEKAMAKLGMGALLGVGQGSDMESQLAIVRWNGAADKDGEAQRPIAFVGKGVTFDSGGISIKPARGMELMKWDMGGAGIVIGVMKALAERNAPVNAVGVVGLVENMPSAKAQRPGDVVTSLSGQTIEVINTDAEGRLVLADALWYTSERFRPKVMIDLATLTGAMIISLGSEYAGFFTDNDALAARLAVAGAVTGDKVWRLPLHENYDKLIDTPTADMKNVAGREAGAITAAQFLKRFVRRAPWAHIDVAGMVWSDKDGPLWEKGATGYGVRLLDRLVADNYEDKDGR